MPVTEIDETTATGPTDLGAVDKRAFPESEVIAGPVKQEGRRVHPFEKLQRDVLTDVGVQVTPGSLMLASDLLNSVAQLEFVDKDLLDEQAARLVEIREKENPTARQMWGPTAMKIAKKGLQMRLDGGAELLVPKAA